MFESGTRCIYITPKHNSIVCDNLQSNPKMLKNLYRPFVTCLLTSALSVISVNALPSSYFASNSRLGSGHWVKIRVTENGMQELSFDALRAMGFDDPSKVAVFGYPSWTLGSYTFDTSMPDDMPAVPSAVYGDKLVFYGEGYFHANCNTVTISGFTCPNTTLTRNLDGKESFYYLTDSYAPTPVEISDVELENENIRTDAFGVVVVDYRERFPGDATGQVGAFLAGDNYATEYKAIDLNLPSLNSTYYNPVIVSGGITSFCASTASNFYSLSLGTVCNSKNRFKKGYGSDPSHSCYFYTPFTSSFASVTKTPNDIYPLALSFTGTYTGATELSFDYFAVTYPRQAKLSPKSQDAMLVAQLDQAQGLELSGATENTRVWNVCNPMAPFEMKLQDEEGHRRVVADRKYELVNSGGGLQLVAFDPTRTLNVPEVVGELSNQDLHSIEVPEMLIVSSPVNMEQALRLAELHRTYTGTDVKVVEFSQVCNEFGSGSRHPMAIRRMAKMLYDRDPDRFKAILLMARAARDNNGAVKTETDQQFDDIYIPILHCEDYENNFSGQIPTSYGTDAIYGMLGDGFTYNHGTSQNFLVGGLDIQVARIPAYNAGEAMAYVNKVERYLTNPSSAPLWNNALVFANQGDNNMHIIQGEQIRDLIDMHSPSTTVVTYTDALKNDPAAEMRLQTALSRGVSYWHYIGHSGGASSIVGWDINKNHSVTIPDPPFCVFATCQTQIMDLQLQSLQVDMLFNEAGGMMGGIGSIRSVYANYNHIPSQMSARGYFGQKAGATYGQVWQTGRNLLAANPKQFDSNINTAMQVNTMSFNFIGDPMLPMLIPSGSVKITAINDNSVPASIEFPSLQTQKFEGAVYTVGGDVDTSFNGTVLVQIYDGNFGTTIVTPANADGTTIPDLDLNFDDYLMQQVKFEVKDGRFAGNVTFALPHHVGDYNRVTLFAQSDDLKRTAVGTLDNVKILQNTDLDTEEVTLPEITSMYAANADFQEGDCLPADFTVYAEVEPGSLGLVGASDRVGGAVNLMLDSYKRYTNVDTYFSVDADGNGHLAMPLTQISDGHHSLTLSVADPSGETVQRTINFIVASVTEGVVKIDQEFCTRQAVLDVEHGHDLETSGRVVITDPAGRVVFTQENASFPFTWNLTDNDGNEVSTGIYSAKVFFKAERRYGFAAPARIIVGKK